MAVASSWNYFQVLVTIWHDELYLNIVYSSFNYWIHLPLEYKFHEVKDFLTIARKSSLAQRKMLNKHLLLNGILILPRLCGLRNVSNLSCSLPLHLKQSTVFLCKQEWNFIWGPLVRMWDVVGIKGDLCSGNGSVSLCSGSPTFSLFLSTSNFNVVCELEYTTFGPFFCILHCCFCSSRYMEGTRTYWIFPLQT